MAFTPWANSPEYSAAKKIVADAAGRIKTIKDDMARIQPKLSTYKKETLQRLIKDADAGYAAALKKNQEYSGKGPEHTYMNAIQQEADDRLRRAKQYYESEMATVKGES